MSSSAFSTSENISLERQTEIDQDTVDFEFIWNEDNRSLCKTWINKNQFKKVCLQFPDSYLKYSIKICDDLKNNCSESKFFILADTSYGSCCVDEIAAAHVESDCVVHFGNACKSKVSRLPVLYIFHQLPFDYDKLKHHLVNETGLENENIQIILDIGYQYILNEKYKDIYDNIKNIFLKPEKITINKYPVEFSMHNQNNETENFDRVCIFIGRDSQTFFNASVTIKAVKWFIYDPSTNEFNNVKPLTTNFIKRRYYYIEKCKDAKRLGLIIATLTNDGYLDIVKRIKDMAKSRGIKTHLISVGRVNPAKLANFIEIDCFVLIGCPFNNLYTSREFFKPIVSVFEAEMALNPSWKDKFPEIYVTNFKDILPNGKFHIEFDSNTADHDISLLTGRIRNNETNNTSLYFGTGELTEKKFQQIANTGSSISYEDRSWKGLNPDLEKREPAVLEKGLKGIPLKYTKD